MGLIMKRKTSSLNKVKITGASSINYVNRCISNNINLKNINRTSSGEIEFEVSDKDYKNLSKVDNTGCQISLIRQGGKKRVFQFLIYRIGFIIGMAVSLILFMLVDNRLLQIHITGLISTNREEVVKYLDKIGVTKFSYMNYDKKAIEDSLAEEFNFSLVSIITKGNSIIISVKEELPSIEDSYIPITADYNMVIKSITVFAGTCKVKKGDIVYKGDVLVEPYVKSGDSIVYVSPCAEIVADVFFSNSYLFKNSEEKFVGTGKKEIIKAQINLGKYVIDEQSQNTEFSEFEIEHMETKLSSLFLPININKIYAYELEKTIITRDFVAEKDGIILSQKEKLYLTIPANILVESEDVDIIEISDGYIINVYLSSVVNLRYS